MDKPAAPKNRLNIHCCRIHQILSTKSTISSKTLAEMVLLPNNSISDMSCFLRASVLLSKEQSGTVDMASKYILASILTIYINHSTRTEWTDTISIAYSMLAPEYMSTSYKEDQN